jgi:hypothetical protein
MIITYRIYAMGTKVWRRNGERHRKDGPALIRYDGREFYFIRGIVQ